MCIQKRMGLRGAVVALALSVLSGGAGGGECLKLDFSPTPAMRLRAQSEAHKMRLAVGRCEQAPVVDGVLDDAVWTAARAVNLPDTPTTVMKVRFDDTALYFGVVCQESPGQKREDPPVVARNAWLNDCLELFFRPSAESLTYQFVISAANTIFVGCGQEGDYHADWSHAVKRDVKGWTAEFAIPYKALGLSRSIRDMDFNMHRVGPNLPLRSWARPERATDAGCLVLEGVTDTVERPTAVGPQDDPSQMLTQTGTSLGIQLERFEAEPGERTLPIELTLHPTGSLANVKLEVRLYAAGKVEPLESLSVMPTTNTAVLNVDLLVRGLSRGRLDVSVMEGETSTGSASLNLTRKPCLRPMKAGERIPVQWDVPAGLEPSAAWPVTVGLPFPAGALWEPESGSFPLRFVDQAGVEISAQFEVTARWAPEGSVKWLRADALVIPSNGCFMEAKCAAAPVPDALRVTQTHETILIESGALKYVLGKGISPIREIWHSNKRVAWSEGTRGLYAQTAQGALGMASEKEESVRIESSGPVAACVRFEGWYLTEKGEKLARHITRVEAFTGQAFLRVTHTLVLTEDTNKTWFKELGWEFAVEPGAAPEAIFGQAPPALEARKTVTTPLGGRVRSAYMFQDSHYRFSQGSNHYLVATVAKDGRETRVAEGEECGDWAVVRGQANGFMMGCRDAARQHPKEFEVFSNRVVLKLFSSRAGEELDYRTTTLMKHWNLPDWIKRHNRMGASNGRRDEKEFIAKLEAYQNNAAGGARTHDLFFAITEPGRPVESLARQGSLQSATIQGLVDPVWSYQTYVMGPNYPRDTKRFPEFEQGVSALLRYYMDADSAWGENGFVDYCAGPHGIGTMSDGKTPSLFRYIEFSYYFRAQIWLLYARSGDRQIRRFAEGSNRSYLDNRFVHWGDQRGYFRCNNGAVVNEVPIYWHNVYRALELGELVDNFTRHYYLTGDRRMKDGLVECAAAFKAAWSDSKVRTDFTKNQLVQHCMQLYAFTGDQELLAQGLRTLDLITDSRNGILLEPRAYNSSTYKAEQAVRSLVTAYWLYPAPRLLHVCRQVAEYLQEYPYPPFGYTRPGSIVGPFLYEVTRNPAHAQSLALAVRSIGGLYDATTGKLDPALLPKVGIPPYTPFVFDAGYLLDTLVRAGLDRSPTVASWVCYTDELGSAQPVLRKTKSATFRLNYQAAGAPRIRMLDSAVNQINQHDIGVITAKAFGPTLSKGEVVIPQDVPPGDYTVRFEACGPVALFASSLIPFVLYAPDYWMPLTSHDRQRPALRYYFNLPTNAAQGKIFFSAPAQLFDPQGRGWPQDAPMQGWIELPEDKPGLWSFDILQQGMVRVKNLPPFFAFNDARAYFEPVMDWKTAQSSDSDAAPARSDATYVAGPGNPSNNLALNLSGRKYFQITPPKEQGSAFFPNTEGTLEFYIRPNWDFFALKEGDMKGLVGPGFFVDVQRSNMRFSWDVQGKAGQIPYAGCRTGPSMLLKDRWTHVAVVWGPSQKPEVIWGQYGAKSITSQQRHKKVELTIYVNGKKSVQTYNNSPIPSDNQPFLPLSSLSIGGQGESNRIDAVIDNLRLSDTQRYRDNFMPPPPDMEFRPDGHTRALFLFNGHTQGEGVAPGCSSNLSIAGSVRK